MTTGESFKCPNLRLHHHYHLSLHSHHVPPMSNQSLVMPSQYLSELLISGTLPVFTPMHAKIR